MADLRPDEYRKIFRAATKKDAPRVTHGHVSADVPTADAKGVSERAKKTEEKRQSGKAPVVRGNDWWDQPTADPDGVIERAARGQLDRIARGGR